ncbi:sorbosone dehydrogenase family protein, partial [Streptomyces sp. SM12]|uniref:PQQ-dependent sugar dehydrogenase n=1 Tax=Streptomyces sp. SM12 TaxID=1071602 RepID=UPI000CD54861
WGLAELPDGDLLIGSRDTGTIHRLTPATGETSVVGTVPGVDATDGTGLLGLTVEDGFVHAYYASTESVRIGRFAYQGDRAPAQRLGGFSGVVTGLPRATGDGGGRVGFGPDGHFYASVGADAATEGTGEAGKLLRTTESGAAPQEGNVEPGSLVFAGDDAAVQGFTWDQVGRTWLVDDDGRLDMIDTTVEGSSAPVTLHTWDQGVDPGSLTYAGSALWMTDGAERRLWRAPLDGPRLVSEPVALELEGAGPLSAVLAAGDGTLWALDDTSLLAVDIG